MNERRTVGGGGETQGGGGGSIKLAFFRMRKGGPGLPIYSIMESIRIFG